MFWLDWQLSLFMFVLGPVIAGVVVIAGRRMRHLSRNLQAGFGGFRGRALQAGDRLPTVRQLAEHRGRPAGP